MNIGRVLFSSFLTWLLFWKSSRMGANILEKSWAQLRNFAPFICSWDRHGDRSAQLDIRADIQVIVGNDDKKI